MNLKVTRMPSRPLHQTTPPSGGRCARESEHRAAIGVLQLAQHETHERAAASAEAKAAAEAEADAHAVAQADRWRLRVAAQLLWEGAVEPWPATLVLLVRDRLTRTPLLRLTIKPLLLW